MESSPTKITSIQDLLNELEDRKDQSLYFRGEANSTWEFGASLFRKDYMTKAREAGKTEIKDSKMSLEQYEEGMIAEIIKHFPIELKNLTRFEMLSKLQHHGLPTKLLDATKSPLVAMFFACANNDEVDKDGIVYILEGEVVRQKDVGDKLNEQERAFIVDPNYDHDRVRAQQGAFILENEFGFAKELISSEIIIPMEYKKDILEQLHFIGINSYTLFPDLDHMAKSVKEFYIQKLSETTFINFSRGVTAVFGAKVYGTAEAST